MKRQDLKVIAVLAVPNPKQPQSLTSCGGIPRPQSTNSIGSLATATLEDESSHGKPPFVPLISSRKSSLGEEEEWIVQDDTSFVGQQTTPILDKKIAPFGKKNPENLESNLTIDSSQPSTPVRRVYLYNKPQHQTRRQRRAVVVHSEEVRSI